jgi:uncharacterized protein (TIGR02145 family)
MNKLKNISFLATMILIIVFPSCEKSELPTVTTKPVSSITQTSAICQGKVIDDGGAKITSQGICWSTSQNPIIEQSETSDWEAGGNFKCTLTDLSPNTQYYIRAFATNKEGVGYGDQLSFNTKQLDVPLLTAELIGADTYSASVMGKVLSDNGRPISARGFCWSLEPSPTINNLNVYIDPGQEFHSAIFPLISGKNYYLKAFAHNEIGVGYSNEINFTTEAVLPEIKTSEITLITSNSAVSGGEILNYVAVTAKGICWSDFDIPTTNDSKTNEGNSEGNFVSNLTGLTPGTEYFVRAYATNSAGTGYGEVEFFETEIIPELPTILTNEVIEYTSECATIEGIIIKHGSSQVKQIGIFYGTSPNPEVTGTRYYLLGSIEPFTFQICGLEYTTTYYVKAYAENDEGIGYGNEVSFTTPPELPYTYLNRFELVSECTVEVWGGWLDDGGTPILNCGFCWNTTPGPTIEDKMILRGSINTYFGGWIVGLNENTTYYIRAFAINEVGISYSDEGTITTEDLSPLVDVDGNVYKISTFGEFTWMVENLKTTHYNDGSLIPLITESTEWDSLLTPAYCWYNNNPDMYKDDFGGLYNWYAVDHGNLCPAGWHVPQQFEWERLVDVLKAYGNIAKSMASASGWIPSSVADTPGNDQAKNNFSGFNGIPVGYASSNTFTSPGFLCAWWSSWSLIIYKPGWAFLLYNNESKFFSTYLEFTTGLPIRCIKDR